MSWCVVFFLEDETYEVIPHTWLKGDTSCEFPVVRGFKLYELIKKRASPDCFWKVFQIDVLGRYGDFDHAQRQCDLARDGVGISSNNIDEEGPSEVSQQFSQARGKAVRTRRTQIADFKGQAKTRTPQANDVVQVTKGPTLSPQVLAIGYENDREIILENFAGPAVPLIPNNEECINHLRLLQKKIDDVYTSKMKQKMFRQLYLANDKLDELAKKVNALTLPQTNVVEEVEGGALFDTWKMFPINSDENLAIVETEILSNNDLFQKLARKFSLVGGNNPKEITRSVLYLLLTNEMGTKYSFDGAKGKKKFKGLKLFELLLEAVRMNPKTQNATEKEMLPELRQWLAQAKFRKNKN